MKDLTEQVCLQFVFERWQRICCSDVLRDPKSTKLEHQIKPMVKLFFICALKARTWNIPVISDRFPLPGVVVLQCVCRVWPEILWKTSVEAHVNRSQSL